MLWAGNDPREKYVYEHLVKIVGTEIDIRKRQRLFIITDMITNKCVFLNTFITSGSLAEGLQLPDSDLDIMIVIGNVDVLQNERNIKYPIHCTTLIMETDIDHPGFTRLRTVAANVGESIVVLGADEKHYVSVNSFIDSHKKMCKIPFSLHGPCLSDEEQTHDFAFCLWSRYLPHNMRPWASRRRRQWPSNFVIDSIINYGCLLVPIGPKTLSYTDKLWRLSFSLAEKILVHSFNFTQLICYGLLKLTLKRIVNKKDHVRDLLCSYFLKTSLFWVSEEVDIDTFQLPNLFKCFFLCLNKLKAWIINCYCPNYFIPEHNMFLGKITPYNIKHLLSVINSIQFDGIVGLMNNLFPPEKKCYQLLCSNKEHSSIMLDFLFYRICTLFSTSDISHSYKIQIFIKSLLKSESSLFIIGVCKHQYANICLYAAQQLPSLTTTTTTTNYNIHQLYHRHLQDGLQTNAVSGWLLYASFYYVIKQYGATLSLLDYVLSKCSPNSVVFGRISSTNEDLGFGNYDLRYINMYRQNVNSEMSLIDRMKIAVLSNITFLQHSSLIPEELQLEVKDNAFDIHPVILSYCLRFLCYHHIGDMFSSQQALRDLHSTLYNDTYEIRVNDASNSYTILGVCYEIYGDKTAAFQNYENALQFDTDICSSAEVRKAKLLDV